MGSAKRFARYLTFKLILLFITTVIGVYITILVANMGGYVDKLRMSQLREEIGMKIMRDPALRNVPTTQKKKMIEEKVRLEAERLGLDKPFLILARRNDAEPRSCSVHGERFWLTSGQSDYFGAPPTNLVVDGNIILSDIFPQFVYWFGALSSVWQLVR